jgi:1-acyl-sn-glycerol-3-phosphate acyltransferase
MARAWLLPVLARVSSIGTNVFYRLSRTGARVPRTGPVLLVANHPNSLLDPAMVAVAAERPVRFLAKSTLFSDASVGWLMRAAGAIPVFRQQDDPTQMARNDDTFRAVFEALAAGAAVGIFPEGISHSRPSMAPIKTGAARIALGAAHAARGAFPVIPVGLMLRSKGVFRSRAMLIVGAAVSWADLAHAGADNADAVRTLTGRIDAALHEVTVNLEQWEDRPMVEAAEAIHAAEFGAPRDAGTRVERLRETAGILARLRTANDARWAPLASAVRHHAARLRRMALRPADLQESPRTGTAVWWALRRLPLVGAMVGGVYLIGWIVFLVPYRVTGMVARSAHSEEDTLSTHKVLKGGVIFVLWILVLVAAAWILGGTLAGVLAVVLLPALAIVTIELQERWSGAMLDIRRFFLLRRRSALIAELKSRQHDLAERLDDLRRTAGREHAAGGGAAPASGPTIAPGT